VIAVNAQRSAENAFSPLAPARGCGKPQRKGAGLTSKLAQVPAKQQTQTTLAPMRGARGCAEQVEEEARIQVPGSRLIAELTRCQKRTKPCCDKEVGAESAFRT
jgi:hypothetical protein